MHMFYSTDVYNLFYKVSLKKETAVEMIEFVNFLEVFLQERQQRG